ncbi:MAG: hypothetical protein ABDH49_03975 [Candidatus Hydrothermales bacterium]
MEIKIFEVLDNVEKLGRIISKLESVKIDRNEIKEWIDAKIRK